jgi:hypothetical protein
MRTMLRIECEEFDDAAGPQWGQLMNNPGVPVIAVVDDDESVRESLAGLAEAVGYLLRPRSSCNRPVIVILWRA